MMTITKDELLEKMDHDSDLVLVEVLPPDQYQQTHLPGAINIPLNHLFKENIEAAVPLKTKTNIVLYSENNSCQASTKASMIVETIGYEHVYHYEDGKSGWAQADLPLECGY